MEVIKKDFHQFIPNGWSSTGYISNRARTCAVDHVDLSGWPIDKVVAGCIATICKHSLSLRLAKAPGVTDNILHRVSFLSKITILDVGGCNEISDTGVDIIRRHFPKLQTLLLSNCSQITRLSMVPLIKTLKHCRTFDCSGCTELTDAVMEALAFRCSRLDEYAPLEDLNLSSCPKLTAAGVGIFLQKCTTLITLKLRNCVWCRRNWFCSHARNCTALPASIRLGGNATIQDVDFAWICAGVPQCQCLWFGSNVIVNRQIYQTVG